MKRCTFESSMPMHDRGRQRKLGISLRVLRAGAERVRRGDRAGEFKHCAALVESNRALATERARALVHDPAAVARRDPVGVVVNARAVQPAAALEDDV
jgi:hypothetical protein